MLSKDFYTSVPSFYIFIFSKILVATMPTCSCPTHFKDLICQKLFVCMSCGCAHFVWWPSVVIMLSFLRFVCNVIQCAKGGVKNQILLSQPCKKLILQILVKLAWNLNFFKKRKVWFLRTSVHFINMPRCFHVVTGIKGCLEPNLSWYWFMLIDWLIDWLPSCFGQTLHKWRHVTEKLLAD